QELVDVEGKTVRNGGTYYLVPQLRPGGGGMEAAKVGNEDCPLTVVKSLDENSNGEPIRIASRLRSTFIPEYSLVNLGFADPPKCAPSPFWTVVKDQSERLPSIKLGEYKDSELDYPFKFERVYAASKMYAYKLLYCGSEDEEEEMMCKDIGVYRDQEGYQRLVVSKHNPLVVGFKKAESSTT
uniref:Trypsin inhibitor 2 n=1 Tax=Psophocarpus tetragonolobus TaxID=3891 RepID=IT2_PSOTE|nr:RecName: Full=Trypsin inhibitor 2; AltName: Full=WTI-2 [Psophocarpus tetragonolobus]